MSRPLNLARRPFTNERLPNLVLSIGCALLLAASVRHGIEAWRLAPARTAAVDGELVALEREVADLRQRSQALRGQRAPEPTRLEWDAVRRLVDRRAFSWSALLASLEETMPPGVKLRSIAPGEGEGAFQVQLVAVARTVEDGLAFLAALRERPEFEGAFLNSVADGQDGVDVAYTMRYAPGRGAAEATP
jgi:Tfp pilus assembly protein PilN